MVEQWKDVVGYEGWYEVSDMGNVRSVDRVIVYSNGSRRLTKGVLLKKYPTYDGYHVVSLSKNRKLKVAKVHRLVCLAFLENPEEKPQVNHIDGVKMNNVLSNLEWCTGSENQQHCVDIGLRVSGKGEKSPYNKLKEKDVINIKKMIKCGVKQRDIATIYKVHFATISAINVGKSWSHIV